MKKYFLLFASSLLLAACSSSNDDKVTTKEADTEESASNTDAEDTSAKEEEKTEAEVGKRSNPVALGKSATWPVLYSDGGDPVEGKVTTTISDVVRGDEAYQQLVSENEFNEEAPEGYEWLIFNLKATLDEGSDDIPFNTIQLLVVPIASDGSEVDQSTYATFTDGTSFGAKELYKSGTDEGKVGVLVPVGDDTLIELTDMNTGVFFKVQ